MWLAGQRRDPRIGQAVLNLGGALEYFAENTLNYPTLAYKIAALDAWNRMPRIEPGMPQIVLGAHARREA